MPAGARCLKAKEVRRPRSAPGKSWPPRPGSAARRFCEPGFQRKAALAEGRNRNRSRLPPSRSASRRPLGTDADPLARRGRNFLACAGQRAWLGSLVGIHCSASMVQTHGPQASRCCLFGDGVGLLQARLSSTNKAHTKFSATTAKKRKVRHWRLGPISKVWATLIPGPGCSCSPPAGFAHGCCGHQGLAGALIQLACSGSATAPSSAFASSGGGQSDHPEPRGCISLGQPPSARLVGDRDCCSGQGRREL